MNVFVANAKSPPALAIIRSLGKKGIEIIAASETKDDFPLYSKYVKQKIVFKTKATDGKERIAEVLDIVKQNKFDVFLPVMSENHLRELTVQKAEFEKYTKLPIPDLDAFDTFDSKSQTMKVAIENDVPIPGTLFIDSLDNIPDLKKQKRFPAIVKPIKGEGSFGIKTVFSENELEEYCKIAVPQYGPCIVQDFIFGEKYAAVFIANKNSEIRRFFVHHGIREYPITGGPVCFLQSVHNKDMFEYGKRIIEAIKFSGLAQMEFMIDQDDNIPKLTEVNARFYGATCGAINAGIDLPDALYRIATNGDVETVIDYPAGVKTRYLLYSDTKHMLSVLRGEKSPKYKLGKIKTLINYLNFFGDDGYYVVSMSDPMPMIKKILNLNTD